MEFIISVLEAFSVVGITGAGIAFLLQNKRNID